jgi:PAS domain S-box-containing protein
MDGLPLLPATAVDFLGSGIAIFLSFLALRYAFALVRLQPNNFIWGFLFYFCIAMAAFSLSRGVGHLVRILLVFSDLGDVWKQLSPLSGGFNTVLMISAAAVTIYYHKGLAAYKALDREAEKLSRSASQLQQLNSQLEAMVEERTRNLSESEKKFRNFFENSKDIVYFCDKSGNITDINSSGIQMLGFEEPFTSVNFHSLFNNEEHLGTYLSELSRNGFVSDLEMECRCKNGSPRHILLTANALYDQNNTITGFEGIGKDMTRLRTVTAQLINHEKMASVGQMAAGVAHEINTPLGIILGYTQLMMDDFAPESETCSSLRVVERQTRVCRRIVADLLKFSRQAESAKSEIDLNTIIQEVLAVTEHTLNINGIKVIRSFTPDLATTYGDPEKLQQVFINLFNNAQFAMAAGGELTITTDGNEREVLISVRDTGCGIPEEHKNKIFDPFFTTKDVGQGTGLGLSVTYGIVQEHGGSISVESPPAGVQPEGEPGGTVFTIRLPLSRQPKNNMVKEH